MGMPSAFSASAADFSGMDGQRDLFISRVIHKAYVNVDEAGTEAAAATAITMSPTAVFDPNSPRSSKPIIRSSIYCRNSIGRHPVYGEISRADAVGPI